MIYVDQITEYPLSMIKGAQTRRNGRRWSHMFADDEAELHDMARRIGLQRGWYPDSKIPHYDITPSKRERALAAGAVSITTKEYLRSLR